MIVSTQVQNLCPKACTCDEHDTFCKEPIGASGLPHTLNPSTKKIIINNALARQLSGLDYLSDLETLDLAWNKIPVIDFEQISKNSKLLSLNTSHNLIAELRDSFIPDFLNSGTSLLFDTEEQANSQKFKKLVKINVVDLVLSHNYLVYVKNFTFMRCHKLQTLDLSFNQISILEPYSLFGLSKLEVLNLRGNRLTQVPTMALHSTIYSLSTRFNSYYPSNTRPSSIRYLELSENVLTHIEANSFSMLEKAQELYLESCSIKSIDEQAFKGLHTLYLLSLDKNSLQEVPSKSFSYLSILRSLRLSANNLTSLSPDCFMNLVNLEELYLNNGSFNVIPRNLFNGLSAIKKLEIAHNPNLTNIEEGVFEGLTKLHHLSLYADSLSSLPEYLGDNLNLLDLRENPLYCSCDLKWLTRWLKKFNETLQSAHRTTTPLYNIHSQLDEVQIPMTDSTLIVNLLNLTCAGPPALLGKRVIDLPDHKLECLKPSSELNVNLGYITLFFISFLLTFVCLINFCRNKKHLLVILKENLVQNQISMMLPYTENLHKNVDDIRKETQLYDTDYDSIDYSQPQIYSVNSGQFTYNGGPLFAQHI